MLNIKKIKPMYTKIVTTANRYTEDSVISGIITKTSGGVKEYQTVIEVGTSVTQVKPGDVVMINPMRYIQKKFDTNSIREDTTADNPVVSVNIPIVELDGVSHFLIDQSDIDYIITDYTEDENHSSPIIQPRKPDFSNKPIVM